MRARKALPKEEIARPVWWRPISPVTKTSPTLLLTTGSCRTAACLGQVALLYLVGKAGLGRLLAKRSELSESRDGRGEEVLAAAGDDEGGSGRRVVRVVIDDALGSDLVDRDDALGRARLAVLANDEVEARLSNAQLVVKGEDVEVGPEALNELEALLDSSLVADEEKTSGLLRRGRFGANLV
jgi:hypothetical protein